MPHDLARAAIRHLNQGAELLMSLSDELYVKTAPGLYESGIGSHIRHNLDHVSSFTRGWRKGRVDYDDRPRETRIEEDRRYACDKIRRLVEDLERMEEGTGGLPLLVKMDSGAAASETSVWSRSTVERELQGLISHTIHHYALIAFILRHEGQEPEEDFGVAPSTLKHRHDGIPCAP